MTAILQWALITLGGIYFLTEAVIFAPFRTRFAKGSGFRIGLIYCPACTGFWVGVGSHQWWPWEASVYAAPVVSGIAAMALGAIWSHWKGGNPAYAAEASMRGEERHDDAEETSEDE